MRFRRDLRARIPNRLCISRCVVLPLICSPPRTCMYICQKQGGPPCDISRGGESASSLWEYGVWTAEEPWFTKRTRQNISRIVHVGAINQAGGSSRTDRRAPGPCFCNKVRVVSDLCAISPRHLPRTARDYSLSGPAPSASLLSTMVNPK